MKNMYFYCRFTSDHARFSEKFTLEANILKQITVPSLSTLISGPFLKYLELMVSHFIRNIYPPHV